MKDDSGPRSWDDLGPAPQGQGTPAPLRRQQTTQTFYLRGDPRTRPEPKVTVREMGNDSGGTYWQVDVELGEGFSPNLPGRSAEALDRRVLNLEGEPAKRTLPSFRPEGAPLAYLPRTQTFERRSLSHPNGRAYRPLYVFPPDDRHILTDTSYPWASIGKVMNSDGEAGSGTLVGDRLVLTAKHVAPWRSIGEGDWWMKFVPHYWDGTEPFGSSFVSDLRWPEDSDVAHDYMVMRLYEPLGSGLGYFGSHSWDDDWDEEAVWASVGYPKDVASSQRPAVQLRASVEDDYGSGDGVALETEADLDHGASGGPFWAWFDDQPKIVGVVSGELDFGTSYVVYTSDDYDNAVAGGSHMVHLIDWARANWPA